MTGKNENIMSVILRRLIFIGFSVQIIFGLIWIVKGLGYVQLFGDTAVNVRLSGSMALDDYTGVLYPALLLVVRAITTVIPIYWYSVMYLLQLGLAGFSGFLFLRTMGFCRGRLWMSIWGSLVFMTFPLVLQNHMAILPNSLTISLILIQLAFTKRAWSSLSLVGAIEKTTDETGESNFGKVRLPGKALAADVAKICLFWFLLAINEWVFIYIGAIPVVVILIRDMWHILATRRFAWLYPLLVAGAFLALILGVNGLTQEKGLYNKPEKSVATMLFDRTVWKSKIYRQGAWQVDMVELVGEDIMYQTMRYQGNVKRLLEPAIEEKLGTKAAHDYYLEVSGRVIKQDTAELVHDMFYDLAGYICAPVMTDLLLDGSTYISYTVRNYDVFKRNAPVFSKYYIDYSMLWFEISVLISAVLAILGLFERIRKRKELISESCSARRGVRGAVSQIEIESGLNMILGNRGFVILMICMGLVISLWNMMQGSGVYDYKQAGFTTVLWLAAIIFVSQNEGKMIAPQTKQEEKDSSEEEKIPLPDEILK